MSFGARELLILSVLLPVLLGTLVVFYARRRRRVALLLGEARLIERLGAVGLARFPWLRLKLQSSGPVEDLFQVVDDTRFGLIVFGQPAPSETSSLGALVRTYAIPDDPANDGHRPRE